MRNVVRFGAFAAAMSLALPGCGDTAKEIEREAKDKIVDKVEDRARAADDTATDNAAKALEKEAKALEGGK